MFQYYAVYSRVHVQLWGGDAHTLCTPILYSVLTVSKPGEPPIWDTLLQPAAAHKRDYEGTRAAASSGLSRVGMVGGVVGMLGV